MSLHSQAAMGGRYLVVSDLHVSDIEDHGDGWNLHKSSRFLVDDAFASLLADFVRQTPGAGGRTLVLNGDIFDFDLVTAVPDDPPWPVSPFERKRGLAATEPKSAWKLAYILGQHPRFVAALAEFATAGNRIVYVIGNHDRELHFPQVQRTLAAALEAHAAANGGRIAEAAIRFEPWFFYVPNEIYAEHGNQFDHYSSFRDVLSPTVEGRDGQTIALPMGNLSNRYMGTRMGYFNPHAADFILNFYRYMKHWLDYYAFTRRHLFVNWLVGSILVIFHLLDMKQKLVLRRRDEDALNALARRSNLSLTTLAALSRLQKPPIANRIYRVLREFWIDRLIMMLLMIGGTITLALLPVPLSVKVVVPFMGFPLFYFVYEWLAQGDTVFTVEREIPGFARTIASILPVRIVTFGHTHKPRLIPLGDGTTFVDTGAWAPITNRERNSLVPGFRNYLMATFSDGDTRVVFDSWPAEERAAANTDREAATKAAVG